MTLLQTTEFTLHLDLTQDLQTLIQLFAQSFGMIITLFLDAMMLLQQVQLTLRVSIVSKTY